MMDGKIICSGSGSEKICIGKILYFNAPYPHRIIESAIRRICAKNNWECDFHISTRYGRNNNPVYTLCLLNNSEVYSKLLPQETNAVVTHKINDENLTPEVRARVQELREFITQQKQIIHQAETWTDFLKVDNWGLEFKELELDELTTRKEIQPAIKYRYRLANVPRRYFNDQELFYLTDIDPSLYDAAKQQIKLRPQICSYYTPPAGNNGNTIFARTKTQLTNQQLAQLRDAYQCCNTWGSEQHPQVSCRFKSKSHIVLIRFAAPSQDGILALGFMRDYWLDNQRLIFNYYNN